MSSVVPGAPPESLKAWNQSSTSLYAEWSPIPFGERNGRILGYIVEIKSAEEKGGRGEMKNFTRSRKVIFTRLKKYHKYMVKVRGLTQRGEGPVKDVTAQTDEDGNYVHFATLKTKYYLSFFSESLTASH